jgi:hypothetical protein
MRRYGTHHAPLLNLTRAGRRGTGYRSLHETTSAVGPFYLDDHAAHPTDRRRYGTVSDAKTKGNTGPYQYFRDCSERPSPPAQQARRKSCHAPRMRGHPVRCGFSIPSQTPRSIGSPAGACHRARIRATRWRAMTTECVASSRSSDTASRSRDAKRPRRCRMFSAQGGRGERRMPNAPAASCALGSGRTHTSSNEYIGIARRSRTQ